ncbi:hypothetical protein GLIP_0600 [Aliiglaciecola lipolytica E3]|uniref:Uncharacterized protein n=1 Tax=Aliiglaciecola lipolytica E3 TaxID=1127673 RepID=K6XNI7_9ALTE|nr:hypothetical protein GLIP_0600 [Aliiglaciecola lipolytica E3]
MPPSNNHIIKYHYQLAKNTGNLHTYIKIEYIVKPMIKIKNKLLSGLSGGG